MKDPHARGLISTIHYTLLIKSDVKLPFYVVKWEKDLDRTIDKTEWSAIWSNITSFSPNVIDIETTYKVLSRWYLVPATIAKFAPDYSGLCFRGCSEQGTYIHMWWNCSIIKKKLEKGFFTCLRNV